MLFNVICYLIVQNPAFPSVKLIIINNNKNQGSVQSDGAAAAADDDKLQNKIQLFTAGNTALSLPLPPTSHPFFTWSLSLP